MVVEVDFHAGAETSRVTFESSIKLAADRGDSSLALSLLPSMLAGVGFAVAKPVSQRLVTSTAPLQRIYSKFYEWRQGVRKESPGCPIRMVEVQAETRKPETPAAGVGLFFTGGLDSFASLLLRRREITHLVYLDGYDIKLAHTQVRAQALRAMEEVAGEMGKELVILRSDLRERKLQPSWELYHGAALAAAGLLLQRDLGRLYLSATKTCQHICPLGSHPVLDPLWSTEELEVVHDSCDLSRVEKARLLQECEIALRHLRVCWKNPKDRYNCQRCEKCLRTMVNLELAGLSGRCPSFPEPLSPGSLLDITLNGKILDYWHENLAEARRVGARPELVRVLEQMVSDTPLSRLKRRLTKELRKRLPPGLRGIFGRRRSPFPPAS